MGKAQISMEYMMIVGFVAATIVPLMVLYYSQYEGTYNQINANQIDQVSRKIIDISESVYYLGEGSKTALKVYIPEGVKEISTQNGEVCFTIENSDGTSDIVRMSSVDINGTIECSQGVKVLSIESKGSYVQISSN